MRHTVWSILLLTLLCGVCSAATLSVDPAESTFASGDTVNLTVLVGDVSNLGGFDINLSWNPSVVTLDTKDRNVTIGPLFSGHVNNSAVNTLQKERIRVAAVNPTLDGVSGSATLFTVRLKAVDNTGKSTSVNLTVNNCGFLNSTSGENITVDSIENATITTKKSNVIDARIAVPSNQVITDQESRITASVVNRRGTETSPLDINVSIVNGSGDTVESWNYPDKTIPAWGRFQQVLAWTPAAAGTYNIRVNVTSDDHVSGTQNYTTTVTAREYTLAFTNDYVYGPWDGRSSVDSWFYMGAYVNASQSGNIRFNITAPNHVEVDGGRNQTRYLYASNGNYVGVRMRSNTPGRIAAGDIKFDIAANGKADSVDCPTILIWIPSIQVSSVNSTSATNDKPGELTFNTLHTNNTYDNVTKIVVQSGARGRTLSGLEYLVGYPYGCVEQTTSRMMASLNVKNYYLDRAERPANWDTLRDTVNTSVSGGVQKLVRGGEKGQNSDGGWSLWGGEPSESSSSSYASYTLARINMPGEDLNRLLVGNITNGSTFENGKVNFESLIQWFHDNPDNPASGTWTWSAHVCHSWSPESNTAFVMLIHDMINQTVDVDPEHRGYMEENMRNATRYFVDTQNKGGSWSSGDDQAMATALALWGLEAFALPSDNVTEVQIADAKAAAAEWLIDAPNTDGSWPAGSYYGWHNSGRMTEATGYAVLALNATGIPADNATISGGVNWLIDQYENGGGWGYTWASQVAIDALIQCQPNIITTGTVAVTIDGVEDIGTFSVGATNPRIEYTLTSDQMDTLMTGGDKGRDIFGDGFSTLRSHTLTATLTDSSGPILVSLDHSQSAPVNEIDSRILSNRVIQSFSDEEEPELLQVSTDIGTLADVGVENPYTVGLTSSTPMVAGEEADLTLTVMSDVDVYSPMIEVPISGFSFDNTSVITENGHAGTFEVLNSSTGGGQLAIFIQSIGWVAGDLQTYTFEITPENHGTLEMDLRIRPLNDDAQVTFANETFRVLGRGNVTVSVVDENAAPIVAESIALGANTTTNKSGYDFTGILEGTYPLVVNKTGYPVIHAMARVTPGATALYNITLPSSLADPTLVFSEGGAGSIAGVSAVPAQLSANFAENATYNTTLIGNGGMMGLALEFPQRFLQNSPAIMLNGSVLDQSAYEIRNGTFEYHGANPYTTTNATLIIYDAPNGSNEIGISFTGNAWGDADAKKTGANYITMNDAMFTAQYAVGTRASLATYDYPDVTGDGKINMNDAMFIAQKAVGLRSGTYQPTW